MARFEEAIKVILKHEGGYVDDPDDPGGVTNFGITLPLLNSFPNTGRRFFGHAGPCERADIVNLTKEKATQIYRELIWDPNRYGEIADDLVATKVFDASVNMGARWGELLAQRAANSLGCSLAEDGQIGNKSIAAINTLKSDDFLKAMRNQMELRYLDIVKARPRSAKFLRNWMYRAKWPFPV